MKKVRKERLCSCGSGKLYNQCCGATAQVVSLSQYRWHRTARQLRRKLSEFAEQPCFAREAARAQQLYLENLDPDLVEQYNEFTMEHCFEWFIFDYQLSPHGTGSTVIELFRKSPGLSKEEEALLEDWAKARLSLYEVVDILQGKKVVLEDLLLPRRMTVYNDDVNPEIYPGMILFMRILKVGGEFEFSTSGLALPAFCKEILLKRIKNDMETVGLSSAEQLNSYLQSRSHLINAWVVELGLGYELQTLLEENTKHDLNKKVPGQLAQEIIDLFLDKYEKWIEPPLLVLNSPEEASHSVRGRMQVKSSLKCFEDFQWPDASYAQVARQVVGDLQTRGYNQQQLDAALRLWHDYCTLAHPTFRKSGVWVAAVVYTMARLELDRGINQHTLANHYGVAASSISVNFRALCRTLNLVAFDSRYSTRKSFLAGLNNKYPLLARILKNLKL